MKRLACLLMIAACGGADDVDPQDEEACLHLANGPFQELDAGATRDSSAPNIDDDHVTYRISGDGFVRFGSTGESPYRVYLDADVAVEYTDANGDVVTPESVAGSDACATIARRDTVTLVVGVAYLELSGNDEVDLVIEPVEDEEHAEE
jgi:hypothetical protein